MNREPIQPIRNNPWSNKASLHYPKPVILASVALMFLIASLELVFFGSETVSMIVFAVLCAGLIMLLRMPRLSVLPLMTAVLPIVLLRSFSIGALVLAAIVGTAAGAMLLTANRSPRWTVLLPLAAWAIAYAVTKSATLASLSLLFVPAAVLLAIATRMHQRRTVAIIMTAMGFLISVVAVLAAYLIATYGSIGGDVLRTYFEAQRSWMIGLMESARDEAILVLQEQAGESAESAVSMLTQTMSRENITMLISMLYNILPALVIMMASILAFEAQSCLCGMYLSSDMKEVLTPIATAFSMSTTSAILYLLGFAILLFAPANTLFAAVVQNVYLVLSPGLLLIGWSATMLRFRFSKGGSRTMFIVLCVALVLFSPMSIPSLLAFVGAFTVIISAVGMRWVQKMQSQMSASDFEAWKKDYMKQDPTAHHSPEEEAQSKTSDEADGTDEPQEPNEPENENDDRDGKDDGAE